MGPLVLHLNGPHPSLRHVSRNPRYLSHRLLPQHHPRVRHLDHAAPLNRNTYMVYLRQLLLLQKQGHESLSLDLQRQRR